MKRNDVILFIGTIIISITIGAVGCYFDYGLNRVGGESGHDVLLLGNDTTSKAHKRAMIGALSGGIIGLGLASYLIRMRNNNLAE